MHPVAFACGPIEVLSFSVMFLVALAGSALILAWLLPARGIPSRAWLPLVGLAAVGGVIGARLAYVVAHLEVFSARPLDVVRLDQGGLVFYGGLAGGALAVLAYARLRRIDLPALGDTASVALPLGAAIGRVGCFLNGCCRGVATDAAWGVRFPGAVEAVHPAQLYDAAYNLALFALMMLLFVRRTFPAGAQMWLFLAAYAVARFVVESFRIQSGDIFGLSGAQAISAVVAPVALAAFAMRVRGGRGEATDE